MTDEVWKLLAAVRERFRFGVGRRILRSVGAPSGRTWDEIYDKLGEDADSLRAVKPGRLRDAFEEALFTNDKLVSLYEIDGSQLRGAHKSVDELAATLPKHRMVDAFPFPLAEDVLEGLPLNEAIAVKKIEVEGATVLLFCTNRLIERREDIDLRQLNPVLSSQYDAVVGMKKTYVQSYNAVVLPYGGTVVQVYSDDGDLVTPSSAALDQITLRNAVNEIVGGVFLRSPLNLFHAIRNLYLSEEGVVALLAHTVANGIKHERMKRGRCVREELFHKGGVSAVAGDITPYQIAMRWLIEGNAGNAKPELRLLGNFRQTYQASPMLTDAIVRGCVTYDEVQHVINRLLAHR